jgi:hypothetical protein
MDTRGAIQLNANGGIYVPGSQEPITDTHRRIQELLKEYDPYLELMWIPPESRGSLDTKPWAVVHRPPNADPYYVFYADACDERILARILRADNAKRNVLSEVEAANLAREAMIMKEHKEARMEDHHMAASILRSPKFHYKHNGVDYESWGR